MALKANPGVGVSILPSVEVEMQSSQVMPGPLLRQSRLRVVAQPRAVRLGLALVAAAALGGSVVLASSTPAVSGWWDEAASLALSLAPGLSPGEAAETTAAPSAAPAADASVVLARPLRVPLDPVQDGDLGWTTTAAPAPTELAAVVETAVAPAAVVAEAAVAPAAVVAEAATPPAPAAVLAESVPAQPASEAIAAAAARPRLQVSATNGLVMYSQPRSDSAVVTTLPTGTVVDELPGNAQSASQGWRHVLWNEREGWAAGYLLRSTP
jgi:hypothetical protein